MSNKIAASEALNQLSAAFPGEYVSVKIELHNYSSGNITVEFCCYVESIGHNTAGTLEAALTMALTKKPTKTTLPDADATVDEIQESLISQSVAQAELRQAESDIF
jgi:hypothetical protein